jgi:hypothetical protein
MGMHHANPLLFHELKQQRIGCLGAIRHTSTGMCREDYLNPHFQMIYPPYRHTVGYISRNLDSILMYSLSEQGEQAMISSFADLTKRSSHVPNPNY